ELVDVAELLAIQFVSRIDLLALAVVHSPAVNLHFLAVAQRAVVVAPAADHVEALQREARRVDLLLAAGARGDLAVLRQLPADRRRSAYVRLDGADARRRRGRRRAQDSVQHPRAARHR